MAHFFVLQPGDWAEADAHLCRPLLGSRQARPDKLPWVAVARGLRDGRYDLVRRGEAAGPGLQTILGEAQAHADAAARSWQVAETQGVLFFKKPSLLRPVLTQPPGSTPEPTDDLSSEQLLSPASLAEAATQLRSTDLIAVTPKRGWLMLMPGAAGEFPKMMKAHQIASGIFGRAGAAGLSPYAFFVQNGKLTGANVLEGSGGFMHMSSPDENEWTA